MRYNIIRLITAVALFVCVLISLLTLQDHALFYQEQHSLFLFSREYYHHIIHWEGPLAYIGAFMVQFYYYPWLGASIVAAMLTCIYLMIESIIFRLTGKRDLFQLGVIAAVALYFTLDGIEDSPAWVAISFVGLGLIWIAIRIIFRKRNRKILQQSLKTWQIIMPLALCAIYIFVGFRLEMKDYNREERAMIRAERAVKKGNWDEAIEITSQYLSTGRVNRLMLYLRNIALAEKGELIDHLFDFPQKVGANSLAFPWRRNSRETEHGHWAHEITGDINAAHQWAFEGMTVWGETAQYLRNLGRYNVALGRPEVAKKFADKLGQSLFYKKEAEKIRREARGDEPNELRYAVPDSVTINWVNIYDFRPNLFQNYKADPENKITRQYLIAAMLMSNSLNELMPILNSEDMKSRNIREAVFLYTLDPKAKPLSDFGLEWDEATAQEFSGFYSLLKRGMYNELEGKYGNTFWYYKHILYKPEIK